LIKIELKIRSLLFLLFLFVSFGHQSIGAPLPKILTLENALQFAFQNSISFKILEAQLNSTRLEKNIVDAASLPKLELKATHGLLGTDPQQTPSYASDPRWQQWISSASLGISETLYSNGINSLRSEQAALRVSAAEGRYFIAKEALKLQVTQNFFRYTQALQLLKDQKAHAKLLTKIFDRVRRENSGPSVTRNKMRFTAEVQKAETEILNLEAREYAAKIDLLRILGVSATEAAELTISPDQTSTDQILSTGEKALLSPIRVNELKDRQIQTTEAEISQLRFRQAKRETGPQIIWTAEAGVGSQDYWQTQKEFYENKKQFWKTVVQFSWTLWDAGSKSSSEALAAEALRQAELATRESQINLENEVKLFWLEFVKSYRKLDANKLLLKMEAEIFAEIDADYRNSKVGYLDLMYAIQGLQASQTSLVNSHFELLQLLAKYEYYKKLSEPNL